VVLSPHKRRQTATEVQITTSKARSRGLIKGYRSGLEDKCAQQIEAAGLVVHFEEDKLKYHWPQRQSTYTPDFRVNRSDGTAYYIESKGRFTVADRQKHLLIQTQHPDIEIRFVFSNANQKLYRGSKTSYGQWADKHGFVWANKRIPDEWLEEGDNCDEPE